MKWLKWFTPFRALAVSLVIASMGSIGDLFGGPGGSAWGGVAFIVFVATAIMLWLVDVLLRQFISDHRIIWVVELLALLAMYLLLYR